jgi:hypothetical protein
LASFALTNDWGEYLYYYAAFNTGSLSRTQVSGFHRLKQRRLKRWQNFGGSGSTLIAAEQTGRNAYLMELDPLYCDVIVERWEKFTGRKAERVLAEGVAT